MSETSKESVSQFAADNYEAYQHEEGMAVGMARQSLEFKNGAEQVRVRARSEETPEAMANEFMEKANEIDFESLEFAIDAKSATRAAEGLKSEAAAHYAANTEVYHDMATKEAADAGIAVNLGGVAINVEVQPSTEQQIPVEVKE